MSISTWKLIDGNIVLLDKYTGESTELKHSVIVKNLLTYKYWDYLAWTVASLKDSDVLSIGYGAGTFVQLLNKWGIPSNGIGIELDQNYKEINTSFPGYEVKYCDFKEGLLQMQFKFDTIIIDVYDENGYVDDAYDVEWIENYLSLRKKNGKVVFHCMDIIGSLLAAEVPLPTTPTILSTMLQRIRTVTDEQIFIVPLWSSYLLWIGPHPNKIETVIPQVKWLDSFLRYRMNSIDIPDQNISVLSRPWTYTRIEEMNQCVFLELSKSEPVELERFNDLVQMMSPVLQGKSSINQINNIINTLSKSFIDNTGSNHALSFLFAMVGNWTDSFKVLEDQHLQFSGWSKIHFFKNEI